jgi:tRNA A-37 threonylcarbamoyl transferase component Bud32
MSESSQFLKEILGERYEVLGKLGSGAFGEVYRARDTVLGREVAIKRIRLDVFAEPTQLEEVNKRFLREAQVASQLRHPNVVTTHDIVSAPTMSFIVMELVTGETLAKLLQSKGRLSLMETLDFLSQVAAALDYAHKNHVVHRDVKPANIMIEPSGHVKVMDFGIAKLDSGQNLTATGNIVGTPNYMSPEQARGEKVDGRSDLFSLGCILYECLSGEKAFKGDSVTAVLLKVLSEEPKPVDFAGIGLPAELGPVLKRALAKSASARFGTGAELIEAARGVVASAAAPATLGAIERKPTAAEPPPIPPTVRRAEAEAAPSKGASRRLPLGLAAAILLALLVGFLYSRSGERVKPRAAASEGELVVEEEPGFIGKLLGSPNRLSITVPETTRLSMSLGTELSSETAQAGDEFEATLASPVEIEGIEAVPEGSRIEGHVSHAAGAGDVSGRGAITLELDSLSLPGGGRVAIQAEPISFEARGTKKKDAGIIGGLAGVGAVVGGIVGGKKGAAIGGAAGGGAGTTVVLTTKGEDVVLEEGASFSTRLAAPFTVTKDIPR